LALIGFHWLSSAFIGFFIAGCRLGIGFRHRLWSASVGQHRQASARRRAPLKKGQQRSATVSINR
jgi:hypothetical protein